MNKLDGAIAIVTGAGRGIGRAIALSLASKGARVAVAARSAGELAEVVQTIERNGGQAMAAPTDITEADEVGTLVHATKERWGGLDILVNNAGIVQYGVIDGLSLDSWNAVLQTNVTGTFLCTQAAMQSMGAGGSIINIASTFAVAPVRGYAAYCASNAAILQFTRVAALEGARAGIRVNAIAPGYVETGLNEDALSDPEVRAAVERRIPMGRIAKPEELLAIVSYLASDDSSYVTGSVFTVDGGFALR